MPLNKSKIQKYKLGKKQINFNEILFHCTYFLYHKRSLNYFYIFLSDSHNLCYRLNAKNVDQHQILTADILFIKYTLSNTIYQIPFIKYHLSNTFYQIPFIKYHLSNIIYQIPFIKYFLSDNVYQIPFAVKIFF